MTGAASVDVTLRFVIPLDVPWVVQGAALAVPLGMQIDDEEGLLAFPTVERVADGRLRSSAPAGFNRVDKLDDFEPWASHSSSSADDVQVMVHRIAVSVNVRAIAPIAVAGLEAQHLSGFENLLDSIRQWLDRFTMWARLLLSQPLDRLQPPPQMLNPAWSQVVAWGEVAGVSSRLDSPSRRIAVDIGERPAAIREWAMDGDSTIRLAKLASAQSEPPLAVELLGAARLAAQRRASRLAIVDLGTAAEAVIRLRLGTPPEARRTLGSLVSDARSAGLALESDINAALVDPRNAAVHRGARPPTSTLYRAIEIVQNLVNDEYPGCVRPVAAVPAHRPQRADIRMFLSPHLGAASNADDS